METNLAKWRPQKQKKIRLIQNKTKRRELKKITHTNTHTLTNMHTYKRSSTHTHTQPTLTLVEVK